MEPKLRILHIEDQPADSAIVQERLRREGFDPEIHRVDTQEDFTRALQQGGYALILSDYTLPAMDALDALRLVRQHHPGIPFIFLSGTLGEEQAIECLKLGGTDYVLKQRISRLVPAVRRALQETEEQARRKEAEAARCESQHQLALEVKALSDLHALSTDLLASSSIEQAARQTLDVLVELIGADMGTIQYYDSAAGGLRFVATCGFDKAAIAAMPMICPDFHSTCARALSRRQRVIVEDFQTDPAESAHRDTAARLGYRAALSTPLFAAGEPVGAITLHFHQPHRFADRELRLTDLAAAQAATLMERTRATEQLRRSEERYRTLFNSIDEGFCIVEVLFDQSQKPLDYRFLQVNPAFDRQTRATFAAGKTARECLPDLEQRWFDLFGSVALTGQATRYEDYVASSGIWYTGYAFRVGSPEERQVGILFTDITARKQSEEALRMAVQRFETLANMIPQIVWSTRPDGFHDYCNDRWYEFSGAPKGQPLGFDWAKYIHPDDVPATLQGWQRSLATGQSYEIQYRLRRGSDGAYRWFIGRAEPIRDGAGQIVRWFGTCTEVTGLLETQQALHRRNQHLQLLHQASARLLVGQHPVELLRRLHTQIAETFGTDAFMLYQAEPPSGQANEHLRLLACGGVSDQDKQKLETMRYGRAVCAHPHEALRPIIATHIQDREAPNRRFIRKLGFRSYLYYPLILNNHLHGTVAFASRTRDDYDRADLDFFHTIAGTLAEALERERLESELQRHARNLERAVQERTAKLRDTIAELEGFSYSLVHDMRAPLRAMSSYIEILQTETGPRLQGEEADLLRRVKEAAQRMDQLVTDSLNYSHILRQDLRLGPINLGPLLRGMVETYPDLQPPQADVSVEIGDLFVQGNEAALTQVFSNLLGNAVKFVAPGVHPRVRVWAEQGRIGGLMDKWISGSEASPHQSNNPSIQQSSQLVRIWVEDNGIGIPKEAHETIFGMFQRMHRADEYPGTGIGLAIVKKSLERTGGRITLESESGRGSRFCVELPLAAPSSSATEMEKAA